MWKPQSGLKSQFNNDAFEMCVSSGGNCAAKSPTIYFDTRPGCACGGGDGRRTSENTFRRQRATTAGEKDQNPRREIRVNRRQMYMNYCRVLRQRRCEPRRGDMDQSRAFLLAVKRRRKKKMSQTMRGGCVIMSSGMKSPSSLSNPP